MHKILKCELNHNLQQLLQKLRTAISVTANSVGALLPSLLPADRTDPFSKMLSYF